MRLSPPRLSRAAALRLAMAVAMQRLGLLVERWCFLAQARHPQNLCDQAVA
jgi:DMSO reductase anchor subunit